MLISYSGNSSTIPSSSERPNRKATRVSISIMKRRATRIYRLLSSNFGAFMLGLSTLFFEIKSKHFLLLRNAQCDRYNAVLWSSKEPSKRNSDSSIKCTEVQAFCKSPITGRFRDLDRHHHHHHHHRSIIASPSFCLPGFQFSRRYEEGPQLVRPTELLSNKSPDGASRAPRALYLFLSPRL